MSTEKATKNIDGVEYEVVDTTPVELDPPDPALARWEELAEWDGIVNHGGDAEMVMPFPRPAWADPDYDDIWQSHKSTYYSSRPVRVAARNDPGHVIDGNKWAPAGAIVSGRLSGIRVARIHLTLTTYSAGKWEPKAVGFTPDEALELANVLRAAVDLIGADLDEWPIGAHNAAPVADADCCSSCNEHIVVPAREAQ